MTDTRTRALDEKARAELRRPAKVKWASWKQLNRAARTMAEMLELEYAPDADTISKLIARLDEHAQAETATSEAPAF